jgi:hypothetical protein
MVLPFTSSVTERTLTFGLLDLNGRTLRFTIHIPLFRISRSAALGRINASYIVNGTGPAGFRCRAFSTCSLGIMGRRIPGKRELQQGEPAVMMNYKKKYFLLLKLLL